MSKTAFSTKCDILGFLWVNYRKDIQDNETWQSFFAWADIGLPLAYLSSDALCTVTKEGVKYIEDTWKEFCEMLEIDPDNKYKNLDECFNASPYKNEDGDSDDEEVVEA